MTVLTITMFNKMGKIKFFEKLRHICGICLMSYKFVLVLPLFEASVDSLMCYPDKLRKMQLKQEECLNSIFFTLSAIVIILQVVLINTFQQLMIYNRTFTRNFRLSKFPAIFDYYISSYILIVVITASYSAENDFKNIYGVLA